MAIFNNASECIGNTPLIRLSNYQRRHGLSATIVGKVEYFNPAGSAKDRVALAMLQEGVKAGQIDDDTVLIEPTSGNTGIGLAALCAARGNKIIITMPDTMSVERINLMKAYGAQVVLTPGAKGMAGAIAKAQELASEIDNSFIPGQFTNPANPKAHFDSTGPEIWRDSEGKIDIFVAGVGTGGTITGVSAYLKSKNPDIQVVAVEPATSAVLSGGTAGPHGLQGIGAGFVPDILDTASFDEVITITNEEAYDAGRELAGGEGLLVGITSGAAVAAARKLAERPENKGKMIVALLPDTGERYLTTEMFGF